MYNMISIINTGESWKYEGWILITEGVSTDISLILYLCEVIDVH